MRTRGCARSSGQDRRCGVADEVGRNRIVGVRALAGIDWLKLPASDVAPLAQLIPTGVVHLLHDHAPADEDRPDLKRDAAGGRGPF